MTATFTARYHGRCATCGDHISPGDTCAWIDDEIVHALCEHPTPPPANAEPCPDCWIVRPCWCDA